MARLQGTVLLAACLLAMDAAAARSPLDEELSRAISWKNLPAVRDLLSRGADPRSRDVIGATPLHQVANFWGSTEAMGVLLEAGAALEAADDAGHTPLATALFRGHYLREADGARLALEVAQFLLRRGASAKVVDRDGRSLMHAALDLKHRGLVELLGRHGVPLPDEALALAFTGSPDVELIRLLMPLAKPAQLARRDAAGRTLLHLAAESPATLFFLQWLVERGGDPKARSADGTSVFADAAFRNNLPAMTWLAARGVALDTVTRDGATVLHLAAEDPRQEVLAWLLQRVDPRAARDRWGRRPLDVAIDTPRFARATPEARLALVALLGGSAADVARGRQPATALHRAVRALDIGEVERLLRSGVDVNAKDEHGDTVLRTAIDYSSRLPATPRERAFGRRLLPLVMRHGADPDLRTGLPTLETYAEHARSLGLGAELDRLRERR